MGKCTICGKETWEISFRFGYGSGFDGDDVCWSCADLLDSAVLELRKRFDGAQKTMTGNSVSTVTILEVK